MSCRQIVTSLSFFDFGKFGAFRKSRIPDAYCAKLTFSLKVTFYLKKKKAELKNL